MAFTNGFCSRQQGYTTKTTTGYEATSYLTVYGAACSIYSVHVRIAAAISFAADLRVRIWDFRPQASTTAAPTLGTDRLVAVSGSLVASDLFVWEPPAESWWDARNAAGEIERIRIGFPMDVGLYVQLFDSGGVVADAANMFVSARFLV